MTKVVQLIDKNLEKIKHRGCDYNCLNQPWCCEKNNPVAKYVCYKLYS